MGKSLAVIAAAAISTLGLAVTAQAATPPSFGNINPATKGSITIYKHESKPNGVQKGAVGDESDTIGSDPKPIKGVKFKYFKASNLTLTGDNADASWKKVSAVTDQKLEKACNGVTEASGTPKLDDLTFDGGTMFTATDEQGKTTKAELDVAAYLVCEVESPGRVINRATPFLVTIPHPDTVTNKWHYDVTVYPKNNVSEITKTIEAQKAHGFGQGKEIHWPVTVTVPTLDSTANEHIAYLIVEDGLTDGRYATREVASVKLFNSSETPAPTGGQDLRKDAHWKLSNNSNKLAVGLTKAGIQEAEKKQGGKLQVTFKTTLSSIGDGTVKNKANLRLRTFRHNIPENPPTNPNQPPGTDIPPYPDVPPETPEVTSHWGQLKLKKVDSGDHATALKGATFQVYAATEETAYKEDCSEAVKTGSPLNVATHESFTTNDQGEVDIPGLFVSDSVHEPKDKEYRCYVVVETKAPDGYTLPSNAETKVKVKTGAVTSGQYSVTIENTKSNVPNLPLTGANGRLLMLLIGGAIVAISGGAWVVYRRKTSEN